MQKQKINFKIISDPFVRYSLVLSVGIISAFTLSFTSEWEFDFIQHFPLLPVFLLLAISLANHVKSAASFEPKFFISAIIGYIFWMIFFGIPQFPQYIEILTSDIVADINWWFNALYTYLIIPFYTLFVISGRVRSEYYDNANYTSLLWVVWVYSITLLVRESYDSSSIYIISLNLVTLMLMIANLLFTFISVKLRRELLRRALRQG